MLQIRKFKIPSENIAAENQWRKQTELVCS